MDMLMTSSNLDTTTLLVGLVAFLISYLVMYRRDKEYHLPPGPPVLPIIGTSYAYTGKMDGFIQSRQICGRAMKFYMGHTRGILLNTYGAIKEAAVTKAALFSDRGVHTSYTNTKINPGLKGVILSNFHDRLRSNRSDSLAILRHLGVGRTTMEEKILEEAEDIRKLFGDKNKEPFDPLHILSCAVANVILDIMFNHRHNHTDPELLKIVKCTDDVVKAIRHIMLIDAFHFLRFIPPYSTTYSNLLAAEKDMTEYIWKYARKRMDNFEYGKDSNFVDCWLNRHYNEDKQKPDMDEVNFYHLLRDFLIAGTETTATSLKWTIIFAANRSEVQEKVHEEIRRVVGTDRPVRLSDRESLPYLEAFIWEIQRVNTILPASLPHYTEVDAKIGKYDVPANTMIGFNLHAVHMNKEVFKDPQEFRPERFIDDKGRFVKHPEVIPFSIGKRSCLGELLARQELFLFTASLLQNFNLYGQRE